MGEPVLPNFKRQNDRPGDVFMDVLNRDKLIVAPGTYDAMGAKIARMISEKNKAENKPCFNAVYAGGWSISAMRLAKPDMGFLSLDDMKGVCKPIIEQADPLPVIVDVETGFGNPVTLTRTIEAYHQMGVALAHLEDQDENAVRRCGNLGGKQCVEPKEMVAKIKAWLKVSKDIGTSTRLMVRTDALTAANCGIDNAIERGKRYMEVDHQGLRPAVLWADAMIGDKTIERWVNEFNKFDPNIILGINYSPNKDWMHYYLVNHNRRPPTYEELYDNGRGFRVIWHTILQARAAMEATHNIFSEMAEYGAGALWSLHERQRKHPVGNAQKMSGAEEWQNWEQYIGGEEVIDRYDKSEGYKGHDPKK